MNRDLALSRLVQVGETPMDGKILPVSKEDFGSALFTQKCDELIEVSKAIGAVGLAAPQIGWNAKVYVISVGPTRFRPNLNKIDPYIVVNPEITYIGRKKQDGYEGCWSVAVAGVFGKVSRAFEIKLDYHDQMGAKCSKNISGFEATVNQHEFDHVKDNPKCFLDREVRDLKSPKAYMELMELELKK